MASTHTGADRKPLTRHLMGVMALCALGATTNAACLFDRDDDRAPLLPEPECETDAECAHLDTDDPCFGDAFCNGGSCQIDFLQDDDACQCDHPLHCRNLGFEELGCNVVSCSADHQCSEEIVAAGPSPEDREGDCADRTCDGVSKEPVVTVNLDDIDDDGNACTVDTCTEEGPHNDPVADGTVCGDGICYGASCFAGCVPENPDACGDEGPNEPTNDDGFAATSVSENETSCGMLDGEDTDWFEMYIVDEDFETDIIGFEVMSSAASIELCAFVVCEDGSTPAGGCANRQAGPVGSEGCCWTGDPSTLSPTWDLDCTGSDDDSGTLFYSVRAPNGGACETYRISAHY